jgi:tripartite-type tricarboxylate transporter receptor subunit TctC
MATVLFEQINAISMTHIPYKGGGDALTALMGGQIDLLINPLLGDVRSERIVSIAITGDARSPLAPEVPTFKELGYDFNVGVYYGLMGPKGLPAPLIEQINRVANEALADPAVVETLTRRSGIVMTAMTPPQFHDYLLRDLALWKQVVARRAR